MVFSGALIWGGWFFSGGLFWRGCLLEDKEYGVYGDMAYQRTAGVGAGGFN